MTLSTGVWALDQNLPCALKFVLFVLCDGAGMQRVIKIDQEKLGQKCGLSHLELCEAVVGLEYFGFIENLEGGWVRLCFPPQDFEAAIGKTYSRDRNKPGAVYVLEAEHGFTKIGVSSNVKARARALGFSVGVEVRLVWHFDTNMVEARRFEKAILEHFESSRTKGEWLKVDASHVAAVALAICSRGVEPLSTTFNFTTAQL